MTHVVHAGWLSICLLLVGGGCGAEMQLDTDGVVLAVGQKAAIDIVGTDGGSRLQSETLRLTDAAGRVYEQGGSHPLSINMVSTSRLEFQVPAGIAPGDATVAVATELDETFEGTLRIVRLVAVRDLAGTVWVLAIHSADKVVQLQQIASGSIMGKGLGRVAVGQQGRLLASSPHPSKQLGVAWLAGSGAKSGKAGLSMTDTVEDLAVTSSGQLLVATKKQAYLLEAPKNSQGGISIRATFPGNYSLPVGDPFPPVQQQDLPADKGPAAQLQ